MSVLVKICGLNSPEAATAAASADFAGFVFYPPSPRHLTLERAIAVAAALPKTVKRVALVVDGDDAMLDSLLAAFKLDMLQLHGKESPERVETLRRRYALPVMKAIAVSSAADVARAREYEPVVDWILFDSRPPATPGALPGGNAQAFDWRMVAGQRFSRPWMVSGGLTPENVGRAVAESGAPAVDVSSGVERRPGEKDPERIRAFLAAARSATTEPLRAQSVHR